RVADLALGVAEPHGEHRRRAVAEPAQGFDDLEADRLQALRDLLVLRDARLVEAALRDPDELARDRPVAALEELGHRAVALLGVDRGVGRVHLELLGRADGVLPRRASDRHGDDERRDEPLHAPLPRISSWRSGPAEPILTRVRRRAVRTPVFSTQI